MREFKKSKFRLLYLDPSYEFTGCGFDYPLMTFDEIFESVDYDSLTDDAVILIWVTNAMGTRVSVKMATLGWEEKEILTWSKYDKDYEPLFRAGHDMRHVNERLYMFRRAIPKKPLEKWFFERAVPNQIHTIIKGMKISQKPLQMYDFCEAMVPNGPYLELWARVNNQREGWVSVGNESITYLDKQN